MTSEELVALYQTTLNERYFEKLYKKNHRLITSIICKRHKYNSIVCSYEDYMSEANLAFYNGCIKYSPNSKVKFSTYITRCIENSCNDLQKYSARSKRDMGYTNIPYDSKLNLNDESSLLVSEIIKYEDDVIYKSNLGNDENELYGVLCERLTKCQRDTLHLLNKGLTRQQIGNELNKTRQNIDASVKCIRKVAMECGYRG
jgi:RNA polymerase sigma factor (sigma-70 family)